MSNNPDSGTERREDDESCNKLLSFSQNFNLSEAIRPDTNLHQATPSFLRCSKKMEGITNESYREAVSSGCVPGTKAPSSFRSPVTCENNDKTGRKRKGLGEDLRDSSHCLNSSSGSKNDSSVPVPVMVRHERKVHHYNIPHYSATLGINTLTLSRRKLKDCKPTGVSFTPGVSCTPSGVSFTPSSISLRDEDGRGVGGTPYSPASLSASLGITSLKASSRASGSARSRDHYRIRQKLRPMRAHHNENCLPLAVPAHDSKLKSCDTDIKSREYAMKSHEADQGWNSPLPPLLKIVEQNVTLKTCHVVPAPNLSHSTTVTDITSSQNREEMVGSLLNLSGHLMNTSSHPAAISNDATDEVVSSAVVGKEGEVMCGVGSMQSRHSLRFKSPWRRASVRTVMNYTPVKDGDKLSR